MSPLSITALTIDLLKPFGVFDKLQENIEIPIVYIATKEYLANRFSTRAQYILLKIADWCNVLLHRQDIDDHPSDSTYTDANLIYYVQIAYDIRGE